MDNLQDKIARRAYELFEARGGQHGYHMADWFQAEKEITGKASKAAVRATTASKPAPVVSKTPASVGRKKKVVARV